MPTTEELFEHGDLARSVLEQRLKESSTTEMLSTRDSKVLSVEQEVDGRKFVKRTYEDGAEEGFRAYGLSFEQSFSAMQDRYESAGINVVRSSILPKIDSDGGSETVVVSDYIEGAIDLKNAPFEAKKEAFKGLGSLMNPSIPWIPGSKALTPDLFKVAPNEAGELHPVVVDVDPYIQPKSLGTFMGDYRGSYFTATRMLIEMAADQSNPTEKADLAKAFLSGAMNHIDLDSLSINMHALMAFSELHGMTQGF